MKPIIPGEDGFSIKFIEHPRPKGLKGFLLAIKAIFIKPKFSKEAIKQVEPIRGIKYKGIFIVDDISPMSDEDFKFFNLIKEAIDESDIKL